MNTRKYGSFLALSTALIATTSLAVDEVSFQNPANDFSPSYFWMLNAPLEKSVLHGQLDEMARLGLRAVCPHPFPKMFRPGACSSAMSPDYITPEYWAAYADMIAYAEKKGFHAWFYDEGGWPSGSACRRVAQSDAEGRFCTRYLAPDPTTGEAMLRVEPYGGAWGYNPSMIEPGATERFLELTHVAADKACTGAFGKTIRFAFTDEPTRPGMRTGKLPWCSDFDEQFRARKGYDIRAKAKLLFAWTNATDEASTALRIDYEDVMSQLFVERYLTPIRTWCRAHNVASGGHMNGEDRPERAVRYSSGSVLRSLRALDAPGVDTIWRQIFPKSTTTEGRIAPFPRYAASAAHQNGGRHVLSESNAIYGDSMTPDQMKWVVDAQLVRGVTMFVFAYYAESNADQWMILFEPHSGPAQPYWDYQGSFFRYVHRMGALLAEGRPAAEVAVVYDARDFWASGEICAEAEVAHYAVAHALDQMQCDFDFIDDDQIAAAPIVGGRLQIGKMAYSTIVLPYSTRLLPAARAKLDAFRAAGGRVLTRSEVAHAPRTARATGPNAEDIRVLKRTLEEDAAIYFVVNEATEPRRVRLAFDEGANVRRVNPDSGAFEPVNAFADGFEWEFKSCGSAAFIVNRAQPILNWTARKTQSHAPGRHDFEITPETNAAFKPIRLGDWRPAFGNLFSGRVLYRATFERPTAGSVRIDLGEVRGATRVSVNGQVIDTRFFGPYVFDATAKAGANVLEVEVANTLANALSTDEIRDRLAAEHPPLSSYDPHQRAFDREYNESGLYGPVTVTGR